MPYSLSTAMGSRGTKTHQISHSKASNRQCPPVDGRWKAFVGAMARQARAGVSAERARKAGRREGYAGQNTSQLVTSERECGETKVMWASARVHVEPKDT